MPYLDSNCKKPLFCFFWAKFQENSTNQQIKAPTMIVTS